MHVILKPRTNCHRLALSKAIQAQNHNTVIDLLSNGQEPDCMGLIDRTRRLEPVLVTAASAGFFYSAFLLLNAWADPNIAGNDRRTSLHFAVLTHSPMTVQVLLAGRADVHVRDLHGETALHFAAISENVAFVKQLIMAGADPLTPNEEGDVPLLWGREVDTKGALLEGCWHDMSYTMLFLLNLRTLSAYTTCRPLEKLCKCMRKLLCEYVLHDEADFPGGAESNAPTERLLHLYLFRNPLPADRPRVWHQLQLFQLYVEPLQPTLQKFPRLFWILPVPFDVSQSKEQWKVKLFAASTFLNLLQKGEVVKLEGALITWFWPEILQDMSLLDILSTRNTSSSARSRARQLSTAVLFFSVLATPLPQTTPKKLSSMGTNICHRWVLLQRFLLSNNHRKPKREQPRGNPVLLLSAALRQELARPANFEDRQGGAEDVSQGGTEDVTRRILENRGVARSRKMLKLVQWSHGLGMELPLRGDSVDAMVPYRHEHFAPCVDITTLAWLHPHDRDRHVRFESEGHVYYIRGKQTNGSVTGLIHALARPFDADEVISNMMAGDRWPRAGYLRPFLGETVLKRVRQVDADLVLALLDSPRNDTWISNRLQSLRTNFPEIVQSLVFGPHEIKRMWEANRIDAALRGTHMHFWFEAHVNGYVVPKTSPEFSMLETFLQDMQGWRAFRTEWVIFGEEENIAGSIDLTAQNPNGQLALIDWKRTSSLASKFSSPWTMLPPLDHVPDCAGWHYRLQLNIYRYIVEKYYGFEVAMMLVVCTHPDQQLRPFIDHVPRLDKEIEVVMSLRRDKAHAVDVSGGSDFEEQLEKEMDWLNEQAKAEEAASRRDGRGGPEGPEEAQQPEGLASQALEDDGANPLPEVDDANLRQCKKRRLLPGAAQSMPKFQKEFDSLRAAANTSLQQASIKKPEQSHSLLQQSSYMIKQVRARKPQWPEQLVRLVACACVLPHMRLCDAYLREHIYLIWLMEGGRYLRVHNGQCFLYHDCGAFQVFRGSPPEQTVARIKEFILQVEGFFRSIQGAVDRTQESIVQMVEGMEADANGDIKVLLDKWISAALFMKQLPRGRRAPQFDEVDDAEPEAAATGDAGGWTQSIAIALSKLSVTLQKEVMDDKIYGLMIEWCETPCQKQAGCAYKDICVVYDSNEENVEFVQPSHDNNLYTLIPHALKPSLPDPVLQAASCRLEKFFRETFWRNFDVFLCCQAAQAIAKRGENIDRCFIGESPGGVGQSLYSSHLNAVYGHNHAFIDPNIWYDEQELRKQIEQFAGCFILTAQEAPETSRRMREDLYKKTMSADGMAGRRPYGYVTRMIELTGWKRMEVNRLMQFKGVSEHNFPSILRRSFLWRPHARFVCPQYLEEHYTDAALDGYFPKDPTLKEFLVSGPAIASSMQLQHAFEHTYSRAECIHMIESYCNLGGDQGLTEDKMRIACGLPPRQRAEIAAPGLGPVDDQLSQDQAESVKTGSEAVARRIVEECLSKGFFMFTLQQFKTMSLPSNAPNLDKESMLTQLQEHLLVKQIARKRGKGKQIIVPCVLGQGSLQDVFDLKSSNDTALVFPEMWHTSCLRDFASKHLAREHNVVTMIAFLDASIAALKRKGSGKLTSEVKLRHDALVERRRKLEANEQLIGKLLAAAGGEAGDLEGQASSHRCTGKQQLRHSKTKYRQGSDLIRGRRYACQPGAQQCSRKLLRFLCPQSIDLASWIGKEAFALFFSWVSLAYDSYP